MDMSDSANVATTVGIWVAVVVVVLAVLGAGGSFLVYKLSKTGRHQALTSVGHQSGYITLGLGLGSSRILRRVRAPILAYEPNFSGEVSDPKAEHHLRTSTWPGRLRRHIEANKSKGTRDDPIYHGDTPLHLEIDPKTYRHNSTASWVSLGKLLEAYKKLPIVRGDMLQIEQNKAFLPVHRLWILTLGLVGRYGDRSLDNILSESTRLRAPTPGPDRNRAPSPNRQTPEGYPLTRRTGTQQILLRGTTGAISSYRDGLISAFTFIPHDASFLESIEADKLSLRSLYWLALGAIPCGEGTVYSIVDLEPAGTPSPSSHGFENGSPTGRASNENPPLALVARQTRDELVAQIGTRTRPSIRGCKFVRINNEDRAPFDVIQRFGSGQQTLFGLQEEALDSYSPLPPSDWVKLPPNDASSFSDTSVWALRRSDAQMIARRLLELKWSPEGYLFGRNRATRLWRFLSDATDDLHGLLDRTRLNLHSIGESDRDREQLVAVLDPAIRSSSSGRRQHDRLDRAGTNALFDALQAFSKRLHRNKADEIIGELVGVLFITDPEFRRLVVQSSKHLSSASPPSPQPLPPSAVQNYGQPATTTAATPMAASVITYSRPASAILVPSAFGVRQSFRIDLNWLYHENGATQRYFREVPGREEIHAGLRVVILAALRAGCVSALLKGTWPSEPLLNFFDECPQGLVFS